MKHVECKHLSGLCDISTWVIAQLGRVCCKRLFSLVGTVLAATTCSLLCQGHQDTHRGTPGQCVGYECRISSEEDSLLYPMDFLSLSPKADGNQLYRLKLRFRECPKRQITPGMNVEVRLELSADADSVNKFYVPACSVFKSCNNLCVWVLKKDSTVEKRTVTIDGKFCGDQVIVTSGLSGVEEIVRAGVHVLQEGEKVIVIGQPEQSNVGGLI